MSVNITNPGPQTSFGNTKKILKKSFDTPVSSSHTYAFGSFRLNPAEHLLTRNGARVAIAAKAFDVLIVFLERPGKLIEKDVLLRAVWPDSYVEEGNLCVAISMLRKVLGSNAQGIKYIETVSKHGYRFVSDVRKIEEANIDFAPIAIAEPAEQQVEHRQSDIPLPSLPMPAESELPFPVQSPKSSVLPEDLPPVAPAGNILPQSTARTRKLFDLGLYAGLVLCVLAYVLASVQRSIGALGIQPIKSLAILPLQIIGPASTDRYLGLSVADALTTKLGSTGKLVTRPIRTMQQYLTSSQDPQSVGRDQKVDAVLDGSIQREDDRVRITMELIRVSDGVALWTDTFDEKFIDIFAIEDKVSEDVARSIQLKLTGEEKKRLTKRFTENNAAYSAYIRGRYFWKERTGAGLQKGLEYFQKAIALDPSYAQAYLGIADTYAILGLHSQMPAKEAFPKAKAAAEKAISMDDDIPETHATLGFLHSYYDWDGMAAEMEFKRALQGNPNYAMAHSWRASNLAALKRFPEAMAEARMAEDDDPLSPIITSNAAWVFYYSGKYDQAIEIAKRALEIDSDFPRAHYCLGSLYELQGLYPQAIVEYQKAIALSAGDVDYESSLGHVLAISGNRAEAIKILRNLQEKSTQTYVTPYAIALIYAGLEEKASAIDWLNKAYDDRSTAMPYLAVDPILNNLRSEKRFEDLLQRIGF